MMSRLIRIGNSRGIRIPKELLHLYDLHDGAVLELEQRREGILLRIGSSSQTRIPWEIAYQEMAAEVEEREEWLEWDATAGDGREG